MTTKSHTMTVDANGLGPELWSVVSVLEDLKSSYDYANVTYLHFDRDGDLTITLEWSA